MTATLIDRPPADPHAPFRITADQARDTRRLIDEGLLVPLLPDVVIAASTVLDAQVRAAALLLALPEGLHSRGTIAQRTASWVWCGGEGPPRAAVAVRPGRSRPKVGGLVLHEWVIPPPDVTRLRPAGAAAPLLVTTPARTAADLLRLLPERQALDELARLLAHTDVRGDQIAASLERMSGSRGVAQARARLSRSAARRREEGVSRSVYR